MALTKRRHIVLFVIACTLWQWASCGAYAQIVVTPAEPKLGQKIVLSGVPAESTWTLPEGAEVLAVKPGEWVLFPGKGGDCVVTSDVPPVTETLQVLVVDPADPANKEKWSSKPVTITVTPAKQYTAVVKVSGGAPVVVDPVKPPVDPTQPLAATYVYEKDQGPVPQAVSNALNWLNRERKVLASLCEDDPADGDDDVPEQYRVPLDAARDAGLPALVVTAGGKVVNVVKSPTTEAAVKEAVP